MKLAHLAILTIAWEFVDNQNYAKLGMHPHFRGHRYQEMGVFRDWVYTHLIRSNVVQIRAYGILR